MSDREILESIAIDMTLLSMEYQGDPEAHDQVMQEVKELSDNELIDYIAK